MSEDTSRSGKGLRPYTPALGVDVRQIRAVTLEGAFSLFQGFLEVLSALRPKADTQ
jgi:hypothetical protein